MNFIIILINSLLLCACLLIPNVSFYFILGQLLFLIAYILYKIEQKKKIQASKIIYQHDLPKNASPLIAGCISNERSARYQDLIATIMDLVSREYLRLEIAKHYTNTDIVIRDNTIRDIQDLDIMEQSIIHFILKGEDKILLNDYIKKLTKDVDEVLRLKSLLSSISTKVSKSYYTNNAIIFITLIFAVAEFYLFSMIHNNTLLMIPIFSIILTVVWMISFHAGMFTTVKTKYWKQRNEIVGFKQYLQDYKMIEGAEIQTDKLWPRYIPYMIAFDLMEHLEATDQIQEHKLVTAYHLLEKIVADSEINQTLTKEK